MEIIKALSPMEGITDSVFRQMLCDIGKPDIFFTEFLNVDGFCSNGRKNVVHRIKFVPKERPIIIQLWGNTPENYAETIKEILKLQPDGIDINMGCSVHDVISGGRGSALINNIPLAKQIISTAKESLKDTDIPLSVKTRIGFDKVDIERWIGFLLQQDLDMITVHGRLSKEGYSTPANWEYIGECRVLRDKVCPSTKIVGNGDVKSLREGISLCERYNLDGFMIGRAILNNPWIFSDRDEIPKKERIETFIKHLELFETFWGDSKPFSCQKKYVKAYLSDFDGANEFRQELLRTETLEEMKRVLKLSME